MTVTPAAANLGASSRDDVAPAEKKRHRAQKDRRSMRLQRQRQYRSNQGCYQPTTRAKYRTSWRESRRSTGDAHNASDLSGCTYYTNAHAGRLTAHGDEQSITAY